MKYTAKPGPTDTIAARPPVPAIDGASTERPRRDPRALRARHRGVDPFGCVRVLIICGVEFQYAAARRPNASPEISRAARATQRRNWYAAAARSGSVGARNRRSRASFSRPRPASSISMVAARHCYAARHAQQSQQLRSQRFHLVAAPVHLQFSTSPRTSPPPTSARSRPWEVPVTLFCPSSDLWKRPRASSRGAERRAGPALESRQRHRTCPALSTLTSRRRPPTRLSSLRSSPLGGASAG